MISVNTETTPNMKAKMIHTEEEALGFIQKHGLVTLFPVRGTKLPSLYGSTAGESREEKFRKAWDWADNLAQQKKIFYGKLVRDQVTLISLEIFPYVYKLRHLREEMGEIAGDMLDLLRRHGATSTTKLRKQLHLMGKDRKGLFTRALNQLQLSFVITVVSREKSPKMTYTWDLVERWMPKDLIDKAIKTSRQLAKDRVASKLMKNAVIARAEEADNLLG